MIKFQTISSNIQNIYFLEHGFELEKIMEICTDGVANMVFQSLFYECFYIFQSKPYKGSIEFKVTDCVVCDFQKVSKIGT